MLSYEAFFRLKNCFAVVKLRLGFCANIQRTLVAQCYATLSSSRSRTSRDSSSYDPQRRSISRIPITQMPIRSLPSRNLDSRAHLSSLGAGNNGAITATGLVIVYSRVSQHASRDVTAIFTKAARTMASCSARLLDRRCLRRALSINRETMIRRGHSFLSLSIFVRFIFYINI